MSETTPSALPTPRVEPRMAAGPVVAPTPAPARAPAPARRAVVQPASTTLRQDVLDGLLKALARNQAGESHGGSTWYAAIPGRIWFACKVLAMPVIIAGWLLDKAVSALVVGAAVLLWACWTGIIPDDQISAFMGQLGGRLLGIATKSGVL